MESETPWLPPTPPGTGRTSHDDLAGFWVRLVAHIADQISALMFVLPAAIVASIAGLNETTVGVVGAVAGTLAVARWTERRGGSPLRVQLGVLVIDAADGSFLDRRRALLRGGLPLALGLATQFAWIAVFAVLLDYLWALAEPRKRTWHDMLAGSVVVKR